MKIFNNNKSNGSSDDSINLSDYNRKLEERRSEYEHLNEILHGMRAEVSNLMEQIKDVTDNLVKKNAELFLLEQSIDDLNRSYELLKQNVKYEEEAFSKANNELIKIKKEINESIPYYNKLIAVRNEFESVSLQLIAFKKEIEKIENQNNIISEAPQKREPQNNSVTKTPEQKQKCKAKTKSGSKCKRFAVEGSMYCKSHSSMNK